jgi:Flp pilus assembly protein TadG
MSDFIRRRHPAGQVISEFGVIAVVFVVLIFAVMEMAAAIFAYSTICEAAREAARYAIAHSPTSANPATNAQIQQVAVNAAPTLGLSTSDVSVSWPADSNLPSKDDVKITISYSYSLSIPLIKPITLTLSSTAQSLVSQ